MKFMFETSLGMCYGNVENGKAALYEESTQIIRELYDYQGLSLKDKWLKIYLADDHYGDPEYKVVYID